MDQALHLSSSQRLSMSHSLRQAIEVLQMPQLELSQWIHQEIETNPLLEEISPPSRTLTFSPDYDLPALCSLRDHILNQIHETFPSKQEQTIALSLFDLLDDRGFLLEEPPPTSLSILKTLQTFDPPGLFARNLQESLLLQLKAIGDSTSYLLIQECFQDLLHGRFKAIEKKLGPTSLSHTAKLLSRLSLHPAREFQKEPTPYILSDLKLLKQDDAWLIEVNEDDLPQIKIHPEYSRLKLPKEEKKTLQSWTLSASWLLRALKTRKQILIKIGALLIEKQSAYLENLGPLTPLTLQETAQLLHLHESTLSRALSNKYAETPRGLLPLKSLFTAKPALKNSFDAVKKILTESPALTDLQISQTLNNQGIKISRRTVAKYRAQLKIGKVSARKHFNAKTQRREDAKEIF